MIKKLSILLLFTLVGCTEQRNNACEIGYISALINFRDGGDLKQDGNIIYAKYRDKMRYECKYRERN